MPTTEVAGMKVLTNGSADPSKDASLPLSNQNNRLSNEASNVDCADALIRSILNGTLNHWPSAEMLTDPQLLVERLDFHGVAGLLAPALEAVSDVPQEIEAAIKDRRLSYLFWEDRHRFHIGSAINAFSKAKIKSIVIKGTASAYSIYSDAAHRVRGDTDILIPPSDRERAEKILLDFGFTRAESFARSRGASQIGYSCSEGTGWSHDIDLHWQINNSAFLSHIFSFEEIFSRSIPLVALCETARAPTHIDSLLITCFHRLVHLRAPYTVNGTRHYSSDRLIWLKDIDLLSQELTTNDWAEFVAGSREKGLSQISLSGLTAASEAFGSKVPQDVLHKLSESGEPSRVEAYLYGSGTTRFRFNLAAQSSIWGKVAFVGEHLFPPKKYMKAQFGDRPLAILYIQRGVQGVGKLLSRGSRKP